MSGGPARHAAVVCPPTISRVSGGRAGGFNADGEKMNRREESWGRSKVERQEGRTRRSRRGDAEGSEEGRDRGQQSPTRRKGAVLDREAREGHQGTAQSSRTVAAGVGGSLSNLGATCHTPPLSGKQTGGLHTLPVRAEHRPAFDEWLCGHPPQLTRLDFVESAPIHPTFAAKFMPGHGT